MANHKFNLDNYVPVNERLKSFYAQYPDGRITTDILQLDADTGFVMIKACIYKTSTAETPASTGHAFEERAVGYVNKTSYIENCETSAVGRALALMGYDINKGIASREEMEKVERMSADDTEQPKSNVIPIENGYKVGEHTLTKGNGKITCDCGVARCEHIAAVSQFAMRAVA